MSKSPLFRNAAVEASRAKWLGEIVLIRPASFAMMTSVAAVIAIALGALMASGSYTKRTTVSGQLVPDTGVIKVYAAQPGLVLEKHVKEGQTVNSGDLLFIISSERLSGSVDGVQRAISRQVALRQQSLRDEMTQTKRLQRDQASALRKKIEGLQAEQHNLLQQLVGQRIRVSLADAAVERARRLVTQGYISAEMAQQKQADLLDQRNRLQALQREKISLEREFLAQQDELTSLPLQQNNQLAQIERLLTSTTQEWTEIEGKRRIEITAPESGIGTAITAERGQTTDIGKPLLSIIPNGAVLQAHLFAPSRAIGFVRPGDQVLLRYQAYPYQKFGHARGIIASVSRTALSGNELAGPIGGEALYRITVNLASQTIVAYGRPQTLQAGMFVDADILQEERKLYEWVLEPLISLTGKL